MFSKIGFFMKDKVLSFRSIETMVFLVIWISIFSIPFFHNRYFFDINWEKVVGEWIRISSFLIIFLINIYFLVPKLLFQNRYRTYFFFTPIVILVVLGINILIGIYLLPHPITMPRMDFGPGMPPMELGKNMPAPMGFKPTIPPVEQPIFLVLFDNVILSILVVGASTTFKMGAKWLNEENRRKDIEKEQLKTELAFLRHQVSPHFFMNTLNNIHALIDINSEDAKSTIIQLSVMMRYLLYDTATGETSLKKEVEFIESYINLMKLRFPKNVLVTFTHPTTLPDIKIPPMLFISFLENAFKHGVSYKSESFVALELVIDDGRLKYIIKNSKHKSTDSAQNEHSGIGLTNIKKSLELLFGKDYALNIKDADEEFEVQLIIPIT